MPSSPRAEANPLALKWARESLGYTLEDAAPKVGVTAEKLDRAERGEHLLTLRQAENAAKAYDRPLAALFVPEPPREEPPEAQFRRLPGAPPPPWPHEMRLLIRRVRERQQAAVELYERGHGSMFDGPEGEPSDEVAADREAEDERGCDQ